MSAEAAIWIALSAAVVGAGIWVIWRNRGKEAHHFDVGVSETGAVPRGEDVWSDMEPLGGGRGGVDVTLNPTPGWRTEEMVERETTRYLDDLLDDDNPRHAEWQAAQQARLDAARHHDGSRDETTGTTGDQ